MLSLHRNLSDPRVLNAGRKNLITGQLIPNAAFCNLGILENNCLPIHIFLVRNELIRIIVKNGSCLTVHYVSDFST